MRLPFSVYFVHVMKFSAVLVTIRWLSIYLNFSYFSHCFFLKSHESYSSLPNNRAANLINFLENSILHGLIPSCTFINFGKFQAKTFIFTNKKWKIPTCTALFQPARLLIFGILPACTFIPSCTIIRETRVGLNRNEELVNRGRRSLPLFTCEGAHFI